MYYSTYGFVYVCDCAANAANIAAAAAVAAVAAAFGQALLHLDSCRQAFIEVLVFLAFFCLIFFLRKDIDNKLTRMGVSQSNERVIIRAIEGTTVKLSTTPCTTLENVGHNMQQQLPATSIFPCGL